MNSRKGYYKLMVSSINFTVYSLPFRVRLQFTVHKLINNYKLLIENLLKNENCKMKIACQEVII
ncbi:hypothetical protein A3J32_03490 [Candidatus Saccharibacteria bacterium RIFCSPLOWO2_02_FULL_46_7]|nr:MAG: hypothetical protein A3J32_03490 [Candidatus Saccharibacteria bacterium RIFCSPLOWO2_02_FULL_46_7]